MEKVLEELISECDLMSENMKGGLWRTSGRRIVLDNHSSETFSKPYDKKLMTKEELKNGISLKKFLERLIDGGA